MTRQLVLVAGPSGSGKSRLARQSGAVQVRLDDFYRDADEPDLPMLDGLVDWDDVRSWEPEAAVAALRTLLADGQVTVPLYSISRSATVGSHDLTAPPDALVIAEGIFAPDLLLALRTAGVPTRALYLDRWPLLVFALRLRRDLAQHRKPPLVLIRRGWRLLRTDRELRRRCVALGFHAVPMRRAIRLLRRWTDDHEGTSCQR